MPKMSIYVPDDMKARMDGAGERANWSAIAQRAFSVELDHLEAIKEITTMNDVVERLRASKQKFVEEETAVSREAGVTWAKAEAEYNELRLAAQFNTEGLDLLDGWTAAQAVYQHVYRVEEDPGADELAGLFRLRDEDVESMTAEYVGGFLEGARDVWEEVKQAI